jgi:KDO2-lipid IV(A) lauroyltransferase
MIDWENAQYRLLRLMADGMARLPWKGLRLLADGMAFCFWHAAPSRRRYAISAVEKHLDVSHEEARRIARQSFRENFLSFLEIFHAGRFFTDQSVTALFTPEVKAQLQAQPGAAVIATAHLGSWELMPGLASDITPDREGMVVVRSQRNRALNRLMAELRGARGMLAIDHRKAAEVVVPKLRRHGVVAFLVDHNTSRKESVFLPFLGETAAVNMGPAGIALRTKAAVYPVFLLRDGKGGHILHMLPPLQTAELTGTIQERITRIAEFYTNAVESIVRQYPEQWFWMHTRWKTQPK